jgi:hypothetical protein
MTGILFLKCILVTGLKVRKGFEGKICSCKTPELMQRYKQITLVPDPFILGQI